MITSIKKEAKNLIYKIQQPFVLQNILVFAAFIIPLLIIYFFDAGSFDYLWKGRAPYLLFLWLIILEAALGWKKLKENPPTFWNKKTVFATITLLLPTVYAVGLHLGLQSAIQELGQIIGVPTEQFGEWYLTHSWPFSFEYVLFAGLFIASIWLLYEKKGLKIFSVSSFFIAGVGIFYMIDTFFPYGTFTLLQSFVPVTVSVVIFILNILGYGTRTFLGGEDGLGLTVTGANGSYSAIVSWSCAGSHSLFLYSFMIMLFLRGTSITRTRKIIYVVAGALGTFFVNILRILAILLAGVNSGASLATTFHEFYGEFFFIIWMFIYLTIIYLLETRFFKKYKP
ncbi:MAG: exosortase/archaeosortase family protein [Candidatus Bathyarchaeota archaeon]|nr:exosortase/archaeosortase family protein [Candidatus Bathyarchaeum tardum]WGM88603.1 MAG: exosortase/archaeosortase family protein [Candidatus Bathyarchaeum tardum]